MQHDNFQKKNVLAFELTPGVEGEYKDRICACMVLYTPFPSILICNMTTFRNNVLTFDPTQGVKGVCKDRISVGILLNLTF